MARESFYSVDNYGPVQKAATSLNPKGPQMDDSMPKRNTQSRLRELKAQRERKLNNMALQRAQQKEQMRATKKEKMVP